MGQRLGDYYTTANGDPIYNTGGKTLLLSSMDGCDLREMAFQVAKVNKALGSISQVISRGTRVIFDDSGSCVEHKATKSSLWLEEGNCVYVLPAYVAPASEFERWKQILGRQGN